MSRFAAPAVAVALSLTMLATPAGAASAPPKVSARAAVALDAVSGTFLYRFNAFEPVPPASLAKMLAALVVADYASPDDPMRISRGAATKRPDNIRWPEGLSLTVDDVVHALMLESSNGAAVALADHVSGSVPTFVEMMNAKAASLGARDTRIVDPSGLDAPGQASTAHDLALIAAEVLRHPWLSRVVRTKGRPIPWERGGTYRLHTLNGFVVRYRDAIGVKNGYTSGAGNCLVAAARRDGRTVVTIVLNDGRWYADTVALMAYAFPRSRPGALVAPRGRPAPPDVAVAAPSRAATPLRLTAGLTFAAAIGAVAARRRQVTIARRRRRRAARRPVSR